MLLCACACCRGVLESILRTFVSSQFAEHDKRVLKVLSTVSVLCPLLVSRCIADVTSSVRQLEVKRGVGVDKQLR